MKGLKPLAVTFAISGLWDSIAGVMYLFFIGTGRKIDALPLDPFFAVFLGSFFLCFAYLQFFSALNIKRFSFLVGCLVLGRVFYVIQLYSYMIFVEDFPNTFWFTGLVDSVFVVLYFVFALRGGLTLQELFIPENKNRVRV